MPRPAPSWRILPLAMVPAVLITLALAGQAALGAQPRQPAAATAARDSYLPQVAWSPAPTCADLDAAWGQDWPAAIRIIDGLARGGENCGPEPLASKVYAAHYNYGAALEQAGEVEPAIAQYQAAFLLDPHRREAWAALTRLGRLPPPTPAVCQPGQPLLNAPYQPHWLHTEPWAAIENGRISVGGQPFRVRGVNYYPRAAPWHSFLPQAEPAAMAEELDLIAGAGFNTIRIFLWHDALFTCQPEQAAALAAPFAKIDLLLALAQARGLKVIVTLNDLPDLSYRPLYIDWARYDAQTAFIVQRYRDDPVILAWDLRNEGDIDYGALAPETARFTSQQVLDWLAHASQLVRGIDNRHLLTAGWLGNPLGTAPMVDFLSFHHWSGAEYLSNRAAYYRSQSGLPLLVEEVGRHTWANQPPSPQAEAAQAQFFAEVIGAAEARDLAGWVVWTAFDFAPLPGRPPNYQYFYGLWRADLSPKPALQVLPLAP